MNKATQRGLITLGLGVSVAISSLSVKVVEQFKQIQNQKTGIEQIQQSSQGTGGFNPVQLSKGQEPDDTSERGSGRDSLPV